jgi:hypothetical protein
MTDTTIARLAAIEARLADLEARIGRREDWEREAEAAFRDFPEAMRKAFAERMGQP